MNHFNITEKIRESNQELKRKITIEAFYREMDEFHLRITAIDNKYNFIVMMEAATIEFVNSASFKEIETVYRIALDKYTYEKYKIGQVKI